MTEHSLDPEQVVCDPAHSSPRAVNPHRPNHGCVDGFAEATYGHLTETEILRRLLAFRDSWNAGTMKVSEGRRCAMLLVERARRRSEAGR